MCTRSRRLGRRVSQIWRGRSLSARTGKRALTADEIDYARDVFVDSVDYAGVHITRGSVFTIGSAVTLGTTIHLKAGWGHFRGDGMELTERGKHTLIHEMAHVWQYQHGGLAYIPRSLLAQVRAAARGGDRSGAYNWRSAHKAQRPWPSWNPEQQAAAVEDYNKLLRRRAGAGTALDAADFAVLTEYMHFVWRGEGAPGRR
ncbi:hypothetical protein [Williamsia sp.]|uniref:hypothetical protein n=1 Tax=Williamsia sp. TaxID=1872085 RepID=UPI002F929FDB